MDHFCALDPITKLRRFEEIEGRERGLQIKKRTIAKVKTIGALRRAFKSISRKEEDSEADDIKSEITEPAAVTRPSDTSSRQRQQHRRGSS